MMEKRSNSGGGRSNAKPPSSTNNKAADPRTIFVKFHPPSASITRQHLSDHFSNYGPVNRCSVIRQKQPRSRRADAGGDDDDGAGDVNYDRGSKGYGFVRFVHEEDAKSAAEAISRKQRKNDGRGRKKKGGGGGEIMTVDGTEYRIHAERAVDAVTATAASAQKKKKGCGDATTAATVEDDPPSRGASGDATSSKEEEDAKYKAEAKRKRTSRVIVRNLSFYANEKHVKSAMESEFGQVAAVDLPLVPALPGDDEINDSNKRKKKNAVPRHRGFAFVTFASANDAKRAVERGNAQVKIKGRAVAIDFSVSKAEHRRIAKEAEIKGGEDDGTESESEESSSGSSSSDSDSDSGEDKQKDSQGSSDSDSDSDSEDGSSSSRSDSDSESESEGEEEEACKTTKTDSKGGDAAAKNEAPAFDESEARRTLFLRNVPFDAKRHDVFELFRKFGRIEAVHLVKDRKTGAFKGTAFVRFEDEGGCAAAMEASGGGEGDATQQFVSSKNIAMGLGHDGGEASGGLTLNGRRILVDLAVDRTTASALAVQRDADGKPIKKSVGKDRRNLYLKNEGRVSSRADGADAAAAGAARGGAWEDLPPGDRARRERAFADKSTKLRSPLFFINPNRISVRNLGKHVTESELKSLVFEALKKGLKDGLVTPKDAVAHWRAGGELPHAEVMRRATDPSLVIPPLDEKNVRGAIPSVYIDRDTSGGRKTADAPSRGFGFVEFVHHAHALAALRQLNNNPEYSAAYAAGGKHAAGLLGRKRGKKGNKGKAADPETGAEFLGEDGRVCVPRLIVEFTAENKVKARQQAEKIAQKKANKIKQRIEKKEKQQQERPSDKDKEKKKGRGALQREKKRARKEAGDNDAQTKEEKGRAIKQKSKDTNNTKDEPKEKKAKKVKPQKKRKVDEEENTLEDMIRSYKSSFSKGAALGNKASVEREASGEQLKKRKKSREDVVKKRWFE